MQHFILKQVVKNLHVRYLNSTKLDDGGRPVKIKIKISYEGYEILKALLLEMVHSQNVFVFCFYIHQESSLKKYPFNLILSFNNL